MDKAAQPHKAYSYLMMASHTCCDMNMAALPALLPFLVIHHGIDYAMAAGLVFAGSFLSSLIQPVLGIISDRRQMPQLMGIGIMMAGLGIAAIGFLDSYPAIFAAVTFAGFGSALFHPEGGRMANCVAGEKKGGSIGNFAAGGSLGFVVGPIVTVFAVSVWGMRGTAVLLVPTVVVVLTLIAMHKRLVRLSNMNQCEVREQVAVGGGKDDWPAFLKLCISIFSRSIVLNGLTTFIPLYWVGVLMQTRQQGSLMITVIAISAAVAAFAGGRVADRFGFSRIIRITFVATPPLVLLLALTSNVLLATALVLPLAAAMNLGQAPSVALGQKYLPTRVGTASGITLGLSVSIGGVTAPILGRIGDIYSLTVVLYVMAGVALLGALGTLLIKDPPLPVSVPAAVTADV